MRKSWLVLAVVVLAVVALPARAEANHTLAHKVQILAGKVAALQGRMACLRRTGASTFLGYAYYEGISEGTPPPWDVHTPSTGFDDTHLGVNFIHAVGGPADYWLIAVNNTAACRNRFGIVANPYAGRVVTRAYAAGKKMRLLEAIR